MQDYVFTEEQFPDKNVQITHTSGRASLDPPHVQEHVTCVATKMHNSIRKQDSVH